MAIAKPRFVVDDRGEKTAVILDMAEYKKLLAEAEELEAIRAYDAANAAGNETIPFEQAVKQIEQNRPCLIRSPSCALAIGVTFTDHRQKERGMDGAERSEKGRKERSPRSLLAFSFALFSFLFRL